MLPTRRHSAESSSLRPVGGGCDGSVAVFVSVSLKWPGSPIKTWVPWVPFFRWKGSSDSAPSEPWGNTQIFGLAVHTGEKLWDFESDAVLMDFTPLFPNDDTFVFMSQDGSVYRVPCWPWPWSLWVFCVPG